MWQTLSPSAGEHEANEVGRQQITTGLEARRGI